MYGGIATAFVSGASPKDNVGPKLKTKLGGSAGLTLGWNYVNDNYLFGIEADAQAGHARMRSSVETLSKYVEITDTSTIRARGGMLFGDELDYLVYLTGGVAVTGIETRITYYGVPADDKKRVAGFTFGGGIETWLFDNDWITTRIEYLYVNVPRKSYNISYAGLPVKPITPPLITSGPYSFKTGVHHLRSSWNIHF